MLHCDANIEKHSRGGSNYQRCAFASRPAETKTRIRYCSCCCLLIEASPCRKYRAVAAAVPVASSTTRTATSSLPRAMIPPDSIRVCVNGDTDSDDENSGHTPGAEDGESDDDDSVSIICAGIESFRSMLSYSKLQTLRSINLHGNRLTSLEGLSALPQLEILTLSSNALTTITVRGKILLHSREASTAKGVSNWAVLFCFSFFKKKEKIHE